MKIGIFGAGQMGGAMIEGFIRSNKIKAENILVKGGKTNTAKKLQETLDFSLIKDLHDLATVDLIIIATNPTNVLSVLTSLPSDVIKNKIPVVSVASGINIADMASVLGDNYPFAHCIPNTPVAVNQGVIGISYVPSINEMDKKIIEDILECLGSLIEVSENRLSIFSSVAGCAPAFVALFIEALADGAVLYGMDRKLAYDVVEKMIRGTAELAIETGKHPGELKDGVTSPGGETIKGVAVLEEYGFRNAIIQAVKGTME